MAVPSESESILKEASKPSRVHGVYRHHTVRYRGPAQRLPAPQLRNIGQTFPLYAYEILSLKGLGQQDSSHGAVLNQNIGENNQGLLQNEDMEGGSLILASARLFVHSPMWSQHFPRCPRQNWQGTGEALLWPPYAYHSVLGDRLISRCGLRL